VSNVRGLNQYAHKQKRKRNLDHSWEPRKRQMGPPTANESETMLMPPPQIPKATAKHTKYAIQVEHGMMLYPTSITDLKDAPTDAVQVDSTADDLTIPRSGLKATDREAKLEIDPLVAWIPDISPGLSTGSHQTMRSPPYQPGGSVNPPITKDSGQNAGSYTPIAPSVISEPFWVMSPDLSVWAAETAPSEIGEYFDLHALPSSSSTAGPSGELTTERPVVRRKGPLRPDQRREASEIRKLRACLRCKFLKKTVRSCQSLFLTVLTPISAIRESLAQDVNQVLSVYGRYLVLDWLLKIWTIS
jgi:hypothetical protein